jgi:hypothetical protein
MSPTTVRGLAPPERVFEPVNGPDRTRRQPPDRSLSSD